MSLLTSVIIVNHNTPGVLKECINSMFKFEDPNNLEIFIIDNASTDNSPAVISGICREQKNISAIFLSTLQSFSFANNRGIERAAGGNILIMNPDIIFTEPVIQKLSKKLEAEKEIGAVSPALLGNDGKFQRNYFQRYPTIRQFIYFHSLAAKFFNKSAARMNKFLENQEIDISTGKLYFTEQIPCAFFLTKRTILDETGLMDENFILFFEDVDLSYRLNKKFKLAVDSSLKVTHLGGTSFKSGDNWRMFGRFIASMIYFFRKHYSKPRAILLRVLVTINSNTILLTEHTKKLFGRMDESRFRKHRYLLQLLKDPK